MIVRTSITTSDFELDLPELQNLFCKIYRIVGESLDKFFGRQSNHEAENIIVLKWEPPKLIHDESVPEVVQKAIENAFVAVGLQLKVIILTGEPSPNFDFIPKDI